MATRGRPIKTGSDSDKIAKFEKKPVRVYRSQHCACAVKTRVNLLDDPFCMAHNHVLKLSSK